MSATVDCLVQIWDRGQTRKEVVSVEEEAIRKQCWRPVAAIKAAALLGLPFQDVLERARYGFRPEDKARLFWKMYGEAPHPSPAATPSPEGKALQRTGETAGA